MTGESLLAAILDEPGDDLHRLVYADWLEENGQTDRAEFIRVQVELARIDGMECTCTLDSHLNTIRNPGCPLNPQKDLRHREEQLLDGALSTWNDFPGWLDVWWWTRGFVCSIRLSQQAWLDHGRQIVQAHPVERVELSDRRPQHYHNNPSLGGNPLHGWHMGEVPGALDGHVCLNESLWLLVSVQSGCQVHGPWADFDTCDEAIDAVSNACLAWTSLPP